MLNQVGRYVSTHPFARCLLLAGILLDIQYSAFGAVWTVIGVPRGGPTQYSVPSGAFALPQAANPNPGILPPQSHPHGATYGEWAARWWQWALSSSFGGPSCGAGQAGSVWYLVPLSGSREAVQQCAMPAGKSIFMPVWWVLFGAAAGDCEPSVPNVPCDVKVLQAAAASLVDSATTLDVLIDGVQVQDIVGYRAASPGGFSITLPPENFLSLPPGTYFPQVADGYWLMLTPLTPGKHNIEVHVIATGFDGKQVTHVTVKP